MEDLETDEICDRCKEPFKIAVKDFEQAMKDEEPILCTGCQTKAVDEQIEAEKPPKRCFEYMRKPIEESPEMGDVFANLGREGWELIGFNAGQAYFKREYLEE